MNTDFRHPIRLLHLSGPSAQSLPAIRSEATARARCDPTVADAVPVKKSGRTLFIYSAAQQSTIYEKYWNHMPWIQLEGHWRGEGIWIQLEGDHHCHPWTDRATKEGKTVSSLNIYNISTDQVSKTRSRASKRILLWRGRTVLYLEQGRSEPRFVLINRWSLGKYIQSQYINLFMLSPSQLDTTRVNHFIWSASNLLGHKLNRWICQLDELRGRPKKEASPWDPLRKYPLSVQKQQATFPECYQRKPDDRWKRRCENGSDYINIDWIGWCHHIT